MAIDLFYSMAASSRHSSSFGLSFNCIHTCVCFHVPFKVTFGKEGGLALFTKELFDSVMSLHVNFQMKLLPRIKKFICSSTSKNIYY